MISQRCPRCGSDKIKKGYLPTPFWSKIIFRFNLLCNSCNWEFKGFAIPFLKKSKLDKKTKDVQQYTQLNSLQKNQNPLKKI